MANSYLTFNETTTPANQTKFTYSAWIKRNKLGSDQTIFYNYKDSSNYGYMYFRSGDDLRYFDRVGGGDTAIFATTTKFRDTSGWYHLVLQVDTTQGTNTNRLKFYVNGVQETLTETTYPNQNQALSLPREGTRTIASNNGGGNYFEGLQSHVAFVDSTAPGPTSFGSTDSTSGIWKFKAPSGVTFGNTGFHLKFENSAALGTDSSGNSSTFTVQGNLKQALDTPSNVYATLNPLKILGSANRNISYGNSRFYTGEAYWGTMLSTLSFSSGKFYAEVKLDALQASAGYGALGITDAAEAYRLNDNVPNQSTHSAGCVTDHRSGQSNCKVAGSTVSSNIGNFSNGDIVGIAADMDNKALYLHKNGTYLQIGGVTGVPTSGASKTGALTIPATCVDCMFLISSYTSDATSSINFGNGYFGITAISSAGSNGNGSLFEYDVPSGYYALNTKNINTYG